MLIVNIPISINDGLQCSNISEFDNMLFSEELKLFACPFLR